MPAMPPGSRKAVGVYDRPARADRPRALIVALVLAAIAGAGAIAYWVFGT